MVLIASGAADRDADGRAVGIGLGDGVGAGIAAGARLVLHHEGGGRIFLPEIFREQARHDIGRRAGAERHDDAHGLRRPVLRGRGGEREQERCESEGNSFHWRSFLDFKSACVGSIPVIDDERGNASTQHQKVVVYIRVVVAVRPASIIAFIWRCCIVGYGRQFFWFAIPFDSVPCVNSMGSCALLTSPM